MTVFGGWPSDSDWTCAFHHLSGQFRLVYMLTWWLEVPGAARENKLPCTITL